MRTQTLRKESTGEGDLSESSHHQAAEVVELFCWQRLRKDVRQHAFGLDVKENDGLLFHRFLGQIPNNRTILSAVSNTNARLSYELEWGDPISHRV